MRLLLDTHALLWFVLNNPRLSATARTVIATPSNGVLVSPASYWEIAIKINAGNYALEQSDDSFISRAIEGNDFTVLAIEPRHTSALIGLTNHHKDPFERLLIAQAIVEDIPIVSADAQFDA